jgi:hypothetical protein
MHLESSSALQLRFQCRRNKILYGLEDDQVPLALFSGTIFYRDDERRLQIVQSAHDKEAPYRLPVRIWPSMMDQYYPDTTWLRIGRDVFGELYQYKRQSGFAGWDETLRSLLPDRLAEARQ